MQTGELLKERIEDMFCKWVHADSRTDQKVLKGLRQLSERMLALATKHSAVSEESFKVLWDANWVHVYSSKYAHKVHNTAALIFEEHVLRPLMPIFKEEGKANETK